MSYGWPWERDPGYCNRRGERPVGCAYPKGHEGNCSWQDSIETRGERTGDFLAEYEEAA